MRDDLPLRADLLGFITMATARQKAAARRNLIKARAARRRASGVVASPPRTRTRAAQLARVHRGTLRRSKIRRGKNLTAAARVRQARATGGGAATLRRLTDQNTRTSIRYGKSLAREGRVRDKLRGK